MFEAKPLLHWLLFLAIVAPLVSEDATLPPSFDDIFGGHVEWFDKFHNISNIADVQEVGAKSIEESDQRAAILQKSSSKETGPSVHSDPKSSSKETGPSVHSDPKSSSKETGPSVNSVHSVIAAHSAYSVPPMLFTSTEYPLFAEFHERYNKARSKRILSKRENRSAIVGPPNDSTDLTNFTMIKITDFVTVNKIGIVHVTRADKKFKKKMNFEQIDHSILGLLEIINGLDPNLNENDYTLIQGKRNSFHLMNFISHHGIAKTQCEESENSLVDLVTFEEENLRVDRQVILADIVTVINGRLRCTGTESSEVNDIPCVRSMFNSAKALKLTLSSKSVRDFYQDILRSRNNTVYNIVLNDTHISLTEDGIGYSICSNVGKTVTRVELHDILQGKFFAHLSEISRKLLNSFLHRNVKIQKHFC